METVIEWLLKNASGPTILLLAILYVAHWCRPRVERLLDGHIRLVQTMCMSWERTNELIPNLVEFMKETRRQIQSQHTMILIVEDSITERFMLEKKLAATGDKYGLSVIAVSSIQEAIPLVKQCRIIVLDVLLDATKHPTTSRIFAELAGVPVVIFTALHDPSDLEELAGMEVVHKMNGAGYDDLVRAVERKIGETP